MWRTTSQPPQDIPLAVCEARTLTRADEITVTAVTMELSGAIRHDTTGYAYNENHRWCYFRDMTPEEVLVFKAHDSDSRHASRVAHTAFNDPTCPPGVKTRSVVETAKLRGELLGITKRETGDRSDEIGGQPGDIHSGDRP